MNTNFVENQTSEGLTLNTIKLWSDEEGIVRGEILPSSGETLFTARKNAATFRKLLSSGEPRPFPLDLRAVCSITREAREYYSGPEVTRLTTRTAMLTDSPTSRLTGSFFLRINKLDQPMRLFTSESRALNWLKKGLES